MGLSIELRYSRRTSGGEDMEKESRKIEARESRGLWCRFLLIIFLVVVYLLLLAGGSLLMRTDAEDLQVILFH